MLLSELGHNEARGRQLLTLAPSQRFVMWTHWCCAGGSSSVAMAVAASSPLPVWRACVDQLSLTRPTGVCNHALVSYLGSHCCEIAHKCTSGQPALDRVLMLPAVSQSLG